MDNLFNKRNDGSEFFSTPDDIADNHMTENNPEYTVAKAAEKTTAEAEGEELIAENTVAQFEEADVSDETNTVEQGNIEPENTVENQWENSSYIREY